MSPAKDDDVIGGREIPGFTAEKDSGGIGDAVWWLATKFGWDVYIGLQSYRGIVAKADRPDRP